MSEGRHPQRDFRRWTRDSFSPHFVFPFFSVALDAHYGTAFVFISLPTHVGLGGLYWS